ncbi:hypothetical protein ASZ90_016715 [hydrocarbon metagenome]|uniref:Uncharacterized protein n=1 Tax=hydrocarbon metagenome TaxID=938273 RepID=A0A0W8EH24_9ZZZZ
MQPEWRLPHPGRSGKGSCPLTWASLQIPEVIPDSHRNVQLPLQDKESEFLSRCLQTRVPQLP